MRDFFVDGRTFGYLNPYVIAEIGVNHEGSLEQAKELVRAAARGGAHAAKFQSYKAHLLAAKSTSPAYWDQTKEAATSQFELFQRWDNFGPAEFAELADTCHEVGIDFMTTPFDFQALDDLEPLMPAIKIASADITNVPLIRRAARKGKPVIISTGAATLDEIRFGLDTALGAGAVSVSLLHCVLNYPTRFEDARVGLIADLDREFGAEHAIGYSDHVPPEPDGSTPILHAATLLGARVLEKHFTLDKSRPGNDHYHAVDEHDLRHFTNELARLRQAFGDGTRDLAGQAQAISNARRRIIAVRDLPAGTMVTESDLIPLRSNVGIEISRWDEVVGLRVRHDVAADSPLEFSDFE